MRKALFASAALLTVLPASAYAQSRADFAGKTVTVLSSFASGGGYDLYGRLYAAHIGRHLPGTPTVTVRNMPGAGEIGRAHV